MPKGGVRHMCAIAPVTIRHGSRLYRVRCALTQAEYSAFHVDAVR